MKTYKIWLTCLVDIKDDTTTTDDFKKFVQNNLEQTGSTQDIFGTYETTDLYCEDVYDILEQ